MNSFVAPSPGTADGPDRANHCERSVHPTGEYNLGHLREFHRFIFGDIYDWAGELRTVDITKRDTFCRWIHLDSYSSEIFGKLAGNGVLRGLDRVDFLHGLAETYADINALHPFREGNGRAQRAFLQRLALDAGHPLTWAAWTPSRTQQASRDFVVARG